MHARTVQAQKLTRTSSFLAAPELDRTHCEATDLRRRIQHSEASRGVFRFLALTQSKMIVALAVAFLTVFSLQAQQTNVGGITGVVQDKTGAIVPDAQVTVVNTATNVPQTTATNIKGAYIINVLQIGNYTVAVKKAGFKDMVSHNVAVIAGQTSTADFVLQVGSVNETVDVSATFTGVATTDTQQGTTRTLQELQDLPISLSGNSSRAAVSSVQTMSGVNFNPQGSGGQSFMIVSRAIINGLSGASFGYQIDGVEGGSGGAESGEDWLAPTPDQVAEVRLTDNTDTTQGFNAGTAIALITKSGTNHIHGSLAYYNRNDAFEALNWVVRQKTKDKQNEGDWTLGGPVYIPHVYDGRNKTFFFLSGNVYRYVTTAAPENQASVNSVPTPLMRSGNFTELLGPAVGKDDLGRTVYQGEIYDPSTTRTLADGTVIRDPFMYNGQMNVIPPNQISTISQFFGNHYAQPTTSGVVSNWVGVSAPSSVDRDTWNLRLDQAIGQKHRLTFTVFRDLPWFASISGCPNGSFKVTGSSGYVDALDASSAYVECEGMYRYMISDVWTINPNLFVNLRAGVTRAPHRQDIPLYPQAANAACAAGLTGTLSCNTPRIAIENYSAIGPTQWLTFHAQKTPITVSLSWSKRNHLLTFGADYLAAPYIWGSFAGTVGTFSFNHLETSLPGTLAAKTGAGMASFYLGAVDNGAVTTPQTGKFNAAEMALYAQDKWRVTNKLTLSLGLRWELNFPWNASHDELSSFDPNLPNPGAGGLPGALAIGLKQIGDYYYKAYGPKVGVAYALDSKTALRASFGVGYFPYWSRWYAGGGTLAPTDGFSQTKTLQSLNNGLSGYFNWQSGFPYTFPTLPINNPTLDNGGTISYVDPHFNRPPLVENIGAEIERELPWHIITRVGYVGTLGHREYANYNLNVIQLKYLSLGSLLNQSVTSSQAQAAGIAVPYPGFTGNVAQALKPYPQYATVTDLEPQIGNSSYNSLQVNVQRHFGTLTFLGNFTASKYLTMSDNPGFNASVASLKAQTYQLARQARSLGGYNAGAAGMAGDIPKQVNLSWFWDLPVGQGKKLLGNISKGVDAIADNWRVSAIQNYQSGQPLALTTSQSVVGIGPVWPVLNPGVRIKALGSCGDVHNITTKYLNSAAFSDPAPYTLGDVNVLPSVRGCGYFDEDLGADKGISFGDQKLFTVGVVVTNLLNRHEFTGMNRNIDNSNFGTFTGTSSPRTLQLHAKFAF